MCGIFGMLKVLGEISVQDIEISKAAASLMYRRGPDDEGFWNNDVSAFSFRRLSIIDLSAAGHQPMLSADGRHTIIFNGELYNYQDLKAQLISKGYHFRSRTDTEVVLNALIEWGPEALSKFNGMFAIAFWDAKSQSVLIARDHVGMKPLYYALHKNYFVFGSQLNQVMLVFDKSALSMNRMGLAQFLSVGYYPSPHTVFNEIKQLEPGQWLRADTRGKTEAGTHFDLLSFYYENKSRKTTQAELEAVLGQAVQRHLMSDVPIATFLSGGLDSGIITGLTQKFASSNFTAYTLSNPGTEFDEADRARLVADHLKIRHKIVYPENVLETVKLFQEAYQEPFGDYSAIPSLLVTAEARKEVKVMLSGDGSDEFFFGYNRMTAMLQSAWYYNFPWLLRRFYKRVNPGIQAITFRNIDTMILKKQSFTNPKVLQDLGITVDELAEDFVKPFGKAERLDHDMLIKLNTIHRYFQLQLLKLDRASMYNSIEARVPFADKDLLRYTIAYGAQEATRKNYTVRKIPLQGIYDKLYPHMPVHQGPKKGFTIDMAAMLSGDLKEYFVDVLDSQSFFSTEVDFKFQRTEFLEGHSNHPFFNWFLLSLQTWSNRYFKD